ncbi:MAG: hypothetical protein ACK2TZ_11090, partial [Anaerolineales bacterium]
MITWDMYYKETTRRENEIALAMQDSFIKSVSEVCQSRLTKMGIQVLDNLGTILVQWGERLQCRCSELAMTRSNRTA